MLRDAGFKIGYHLMPNLPGSTSSRDYEMIRDIFQNPLYKPDHLKLYPTTITKFTLLEQWFKNGTYKPYPTEELIAIIVRAKKELIPVWVRIGRLTRDITTNMMTGNAFPPNLREVIQHKLHSQHIQCACIRCREIQLDNPVGSIHVRETEYKAAGGTEFFIEKIDARNKCLGFIRLRFPSYLTDSGVSPLYRILSGSALIRELHVYGMATKIGKLEKRSAQHKGIGEELLDLAEQKTKQAGIRKLAVISGVGVRNYYRKFGYSLNQTYMSKRF
jgi:elongator complex protein 3